VSGLYGERHYLPGQWHVRALRHTGRLPARHDVPGGRRMYGRGLRHGPPLQRLQLLLLGGILRHVYGDRGRLRERDVQHRHLLLRCERGLSRRIVRHAVRSLLLTFHGRSPTPRLASSRAACRYS
jgi:hypothetical protein